MRVCLYTADSETDFNPLIRCALSRWNPPALLNNHTINNPDGTPAFYRGMILCEGIPRASGSFSCVPTKGRENKMPGVKRARLEPPLHRYRIHISSVTPRGREPKFEKPWTRTSSPESRILSVFPPTGGLGVAHGGLVAVELPGLKTSTALGSASRSGESCRLPWRSRPPPSGGGRPADNDVERLLTASGKVSDDDHSRGGWHVRAITRLLIPSRPRVETHAYAPGNRPGFAREGMKT